MGSSDLAELIISGIGQAIVNQLWKNDGDAIKKIENMYSCFIEPNLEMNILTIFGSKND
jgi:hypothetical protein